MKTPPITTDTPRLGAVNGFLILKLRLNGFIVTLGALTMLRGLQVALSQGQSIITLPPSFTYLGSTSWQLLQIRRLLEPQATALAASRITDVDLAVLRDILDQAADAGTAESFIELDMAFHRHIVDLVGNPVLSTLLEIVSTRTQRVRLLRGIDTAAAFGSAHREHEAILAALTARDAPLAAAAAMVHVAAVEQWAAGGGVVQSATPTHLSGEQEAPAACSNLPEPAMLLTSH